MIEVLREMAAVAISAQIGLDLKYFGAPDSVILAGMIIGGLAFFHFLVVIPGRADR